MSPDIGNNKQIAINLGKYQTFILKPEQHARNNKIAQIEYRLHSLLHCPEAEVFFLFPSSDPAQTVGAEAPSWQEQTPSAVLRVGLSKKGTKQEREE